MKFHIEKTVDTPEVLLDTEKKIFSISGNSMPEEVGKFYLPILDWLTEYEKNPLDILQVEIQLDYFNSASLKMITTIFEILERVVIAGKIVKVKWHYEADDDDLLDSGQTLAGVVDIPFEFIPFDVYD